MCALWRLGLFLSCLFVCLEASGWFQLLLVNGLCVGPVTSCVVFVFLVCVSRGIRLMPAVATWTVCGTYGGFCCFCLFDLCV